jgi:hypothetical protein
MDLENEKNGSEVEKKREQKFSRVVISLDSKSVLERLALSVNREFVGGEVNASHIADWLIGKARKGFSKEELKEIRAAHTDERKILELILAGSAKADDLPEPLRKVIREMKGLAPKRPHQRGYEEKEKEAIAVRLEGLQAVGSEPAAAE